MDSATPEGTTRATTGADNNSSSNNGNDNKRQETALPENGSKSTSGTPVEQPLDKPVVVRPSSKPTLNGSPAVPSDDRPEATPMPTADATVSGGDPSLKEDSIAIEGSQMCTSTETGIRRKSSLELRKLPVNVLLRPDVPLFDEELSMDDDTDGDEIDGKRSFLQRTCLNSKFTLRSQMMLSFGVISICTILLVVITCIFVSIVSGEVIKDKTTETLDDLSSLLQGRAARYIAEDLTPRLILDDVVHLIYETTRDRFSGYPTYEDDSQVPFRDTISGTNKYPIVGEPLPLDWQLDANVNNDNFQEHVQDRWPWYTAYPAISTASAAYMMQGTCDPSLTSRTAGYAYLENCTEANNDLSTGGIVAPTRTNEQVHRKASDLNPILKALYEYHQTVSHIGVGFVNGGAGAMVSFPGIQLKPNSSYISLGCDYLKGPHPLNTSRPILLGEELARCESDGLHAEGAVVPSRAFSPIDRPWFKEQVMNPNKVVNTGPFLSGISGEREWFMTVGRSIFDRTTNELIGCISIIFGLQSISEILFDSTVTNNSHVSIVRFDEKGTVLASTAWNMSSATTTASISDIGVGVTQSDYEGLRGLVDYSRVWAADEVQELYENHHIKEGGYHVMAHPMPPPPASYSESYEPEFLVISSIWESDIFVFALQVEDDVDSRVRFLIVLSVVVGLVGLAVVIAMLFMVSHFITLPLRQMNDIAKSIIDNFGDSDDSKISVEDAVLESQQSLVKTELSEIVKEFQKMVSKFSGGAMAKSAKVDVTEVDNQFQMLDDFDELYLSRQDPTFRYNIEDKPQSTQDDDAPTGSARVGSNITSEPAPMSVYSASHGLLKRSLSNGWSSPLFKWIVMLIVLPLLVSTVTISAIVSASVSQELPSMINDAERGLLNLQVAALGVSAGLRAGFVSKASEQSIRDNYLLGRYASWLLFGGLETGKALPEMVAGTEACKNFFNFTDCPFFHENHECDCDWNDDGRECREYSADSRYVQVPYFVASSQDMWPNGDRNLTNYPSLATSANTTAWLERAIGAEVPGSPDGSTAENATSVLSSSVGPSRRRYETTYDRLSTLAAIPIHQPLYNYHERKDSVEGHFVAFEADGLFLGYNGCNNLRHLTSAQWFSQESNGAAKLRPELCPEGKYGYDPRCRGWYESGRQLWLSENDPLYVTPPYAFADGTIGQTCTSPLVDPNTNEHVGQTLFDFLSTRIFATLNKDRTPLAAGGFPMLITMKPDAFGADTVLGPSFSVTNESVPIEDLIVSLDELCDDDDEDEEACGFSAVLESMRAGNRSHGKFVMQDSSGSPVTMHVAYAPVVATSLRQVNASDFSRGVELLEYKLYSLALAEPEASMQEFFEQAADDIDQVIQIGLAILGTLIVLAACVIVFLSHRITVSMTEPMYYLLELIRQINRLDVGEDPPDEDVASGYGSIEVLNVRMTMERLYRIIQCANAAYFAGEVEVAFEVFKDALQLFTRLENKKAIGVANNNLGNTMLTLYRTMEAAGEATICGMSKRQIIGKGMAYFHQAIQLGEKAYDDFYEAEGWSPKCLQFMQHLSNRYFNRAMFLLTVKDGHEKPKEILELGLRDLQITRDMDVEIVDEGTQVGWEIRTAEAHFEVLLCRLRGHITLLEQGYTDDWEVEEMIDDAFHLVKTESRKESSDLFNDVGPAGRMQQVEYKLMRYKMVKDDVAAAAKVGIRMLVEDYFTLTEAQKKAVEVLLAYCVSIQAPSEVQSRLEAYQQWLLKACDEVDGSSRETERISAVLEKATSLSRRWSKKLLESKKSMELSTNGETSVERKSVSFSLRESMRGDITMEKF